MISQLILAFQRIKLGGTIVLLMHKVESWDSLCMLRAFDKFASLRLFKPHKAHMIKSSFYLILQNINPMHPEAVKAISRWKAIWRHATFGSFSEQIVKVGVNEEDIATILEEFGPRWRKLGRPIWSMQAEGLKKSGFITSNR
jgi:hypothetical protein